MRNGLVVLALVLAVCAGSSAYAFQEQNSGTVPQAGVEQAPTQDPAAKALDLSGEATPSQDKGTEIRIPGLGKLGVLPKMDFGLELLYGAADQKSDGVPETVPAPADDMMIRGTVKHRF